MKKLTCKTCAMWTEEGWRVAMMREIPAYAKWGCCQRFTNLRRDAIEEAGALAEAMCLAEGIGGDFMTAPDFGCVQHSDAVAGGDGACCAGASLRGDGGGDLALPPDEPAGGGEVGTITNRTKEAGYDEE